MGRFARIFVLLVGLTVLVSTGSIPAHEAAEDWPLATPESQGIDSVAIAAAIEALRERQSPIHSLLIVRRGYLVTEAYFHPYDGKVPHDIASVTKPITTTLVGLAIKKGLIDSVDEPMLGVLKDYPVANVDRRKESVRIRHLLTMSSGLGCKAQAGEPTLWDMLSSPDNIRFMLDLPMTDDPGARFVYCSGGMHLLSGTISHKSGLNAEAYARRHLFGPLGIRQLIWPRDPQRISHGFGNLHLLPRDMARLGQLFLDHGRWQGRQVVPAEWVEEATRRHLKTGGTGSSDYGYGWRIPVSGSPVTFEASGRGGQQISILRDLQTVIVINGGGFNSGELMKQLTAAIRPEALLQANPAGMSRLRRAIASASLPPAAQPVAPLPALASQISGRSWQLPANWLGIKSIRLRFQPGASTATIDLIFRSALKQYQFGMDAQVLGNKTLAESRPVGLDGVLRISPGGILGLPVGLRGSWVDLQTFQLEYNEIANTNTYLLRMNFEGDRLRVEATERTGLFKESYEGH
ncbi:MAG: class C beta-lactamase-related serine hydrolase [Acidobacteria bacterium]|nr:class C beta-lactamase-related serine hydrolase [Acidobacteriota bacterium]